MKNNDLNMISERAQARRAGISRTTFRQIESELSASHLEANFRLKSLRQWSMARGQNLEILRTPFESTIDSTYSIPVISLEVTRAGFDSWKQHFFEFVDEYRRSRDPRLFISPPVRGLDSKLKALLAAIVLELCHRDFWEAPIWALEVPALDKPWFVSEMNSLVASALLESPLRFKQKNIFVLDNFLERR